MLRVGDYVTGKSVMGAPVTGEIVYTGAKWLVVGDGNRSYYCSPEDVAEMDPPIPNEDVMLDEFDEGGLKKMPDGTLESVHIPEEDDDSYKTVPPKKTGEVYLISKKKKEGAEIPYTATGTGGPPEPKPPVLEWKVAFDSTHVVISLSEFAIPSCMRGIVGAKEEWRHVDGTARSISKFGFWGRKSMKRLEREIAETKEDILRFYNLTKRESGRVE